MADNISSHHSPEPGLWIASLWRTDRTLISAVKCSVFCEANLEKHFRQVLFPCDEYQHFATVGEGDPIGDEKFFSLSRQPNCIPILATQSISSLRSALPGDSWRELFQTFRTKIFLTLSGDFSAKTASELCRREDRLKVSYNLSESADDARVSLLTGNALSHCANISASKRYNTQTDNRFDMKTFTELRNAQSVSRDKSKEISKL